MSKAQVVVSDTVSTLLFRLEGVVYQLKDTPLSSLQHVIALLDQLSILLQREEPASFHINQLFHLIERKHRRRSFLIPEADQYLLAWVSHFRSLYLYEHFAMAGNWPQLIPMYAKLIEVAKEEGGQEYIGHFEGRSSDCLQDLEALSELGFWSMKDCSNDSFSTNLTGNFCVSVTLTTPVSIAQLNRVFCQWSWHLEQHNKSMEAFPLHDLEASFGLSDIVHILASEREVWRGSETLTRLYSLLHRRMITKSALSLDSLLPQSRKTGLMLVEQELDFALLDNESEIAPILSHGQVYFYSQYESRKQRVPLAGSSIPIYIITFAQQEIAIPAYRISLGDVVKPVVGKLSCIEERWVVTQSSEQVPRDEQAYLYVQDKAYLIMADQIERGYGVVQRARYLPNGVLNVWSVRDRFLIEPGLPEELDKQAGSDLWLPSSEDTAADVSVARLLGIRLNSGKLIAVSHEWVESIQPWSSVVPVPGGFVSHFGCVMPLIQVSTTKDLKDVVLFIRGNHYQFALRASGVMNQPQYDSLEKLEDIVLDWQEGYLHLLPREDGGCVLFNEHSALALHKKLLEIFK